MRRLATFMGVTALVSACGDERGSTSQGDGGAAPSVTSGPGGASAGGGGSVGGGGGAGGETCTLESAEDHTAEATVVITHVGARYTPACARILAGSTVTFESNFVTHPLHGGEVIDGVETPDPTSPITSTIAGTMASFVIATPGEYPYYCDFHSSLGMVGVVFAE